MTNTVHPDGPLSPELFAEAMKLAKEDQIKVGDTIQVIKSHKAFLRGKVGVVSWISKSKFDWREYDTSPQAVTLRELRKRHGYAVGFREAPMMPTIFVKAENVKIVNRKPPASSK